MLCSFETVYYNKIDGGSRRGFQVFLSNPRRWLGRLILLMIGIGKVCLYRVGDQGVPVSRLVLLSGLRLMRWILCIVDQSISIHHIPSTFALRCFVLSYLLYAFFMIRIYHIWRYLIYYSQPCVVRFEW